MSNLITNQRRDHHFVDLKVWDNFATPNQKLLYSSLISEPFRVGRQTSKESIQIGLIRSPSERSKLEQKLVIAAAPEQEYSRSFAEINFVKDGIEVCNTSRQAIMVGELMLKPEQHHIVQAPMTVTFVDRTLVIDTIGRSEQDASLFSLPRKQEPVSQAANQQYAPTYSLEQEFSLVAAADDAFIDSDRLLELLQSMLRIFQDSPNTKQFFDQTAMAMIQLLRLDHVLIALDQDHAPELVQVIANNAEFGNWSYFAVQGRSDGSVSEVEESWSPSPHMIQFVETQKETVYQVPSFNTGSFEADNCLVASPILGAGNRLLGFIYGDRRVYSGSMTMFNEAEAKFVELFANGIAVGIHRMNQERKISEMRSRLDQFFTPELAGQLESDPELLNPRSAQVSVLFADIRGFSSISERIGPEKTINWINFAMNLLSDCVFEFDGVVVDYIGDEILAIWGAPVDRENHAELAVRAALRMMEVLPAINAQWQSVIGQPMELGIGIDSGEAQVGNIGSERKFKYGPLGDVVNVASRVQGATKQMGTRLMVTESTARLLPSEIVSRKIRSVRFVNVQRAIGVYEVPLRPCEQWILMKEQYEVGLKLYDQGELRAASQQMAAMINRFPDDLPSVQLLSDSVSGLSTLDQDFDPVWTLGRK